MTKTSTDKNAVPGKKRKKIALGRGLGALIPGGAPETAEAADDGDSAEGEYRLCDIEQIRPNPYQPRRRFDPEELMELSVSIREQGIIQPLVVRRSVSGFDLIAGERRLRAAKMAGLTSVPVLVRKLSDEEVLVVTIVENIQRQNLNPLEEADAYHRLMSEFDMTQEKVAESVGKSRPAVANFLRLRQLPDEIRETLMDASLSMGHAKVLLGAENAAQQMAVWKSVISKELSVRDTERLLNRLKSAKEKTEPQPPSSEEIYYGDLSSDLSRRFGTRVNIRRKGKKGKVEIEFYNDKDLDRVLGILNPES